ncbi:MULTISPECIES: hypothetical protein [Ruminococcus]|uniref:DivIVA domain-containing protein n=1 Tax=Ruminococcus flavefaciens TaxID=1265 RepID=A0A1M7GJ81_RUMFL|nr:MULTISPECIES: hypothetical protein [Ruminococcus]MCR4795916.1 hypothetical protein [Ruminococcus sp.]SHM16261.1 hypothetical protein SAMN04487860_101334 [Ruminococcus flavefaciens]
MQIRFANIKESLEKEEGGYTERSVLRKLEAYDMFVDFAKDPKTIAAKMLPHLERLRQLPLKRVKGGFFSKYGYSVEQVDRLIEKLDAQIMTALEGK